MQIPKPAILIVDDNPANRRLHLVTLQDLGAELYVAASGEEAMARYRERPYAMILLDVHLSDMSGFDVAEKIRELDPDVDTAVVFVSAVHMQQTDAHRGYKLGAVDYIVSPVVRDVLRAKASVFIRLYRMRQEAQQQANEMAKAYRELRTAHAEMEGFSYSVSHDLRTPLSQIIGLANLLADGRGGELPAKALEYANYMREAATNMNSLIDDMLRLANMSRAEIHVEPVNLSHIARDVAGELDKAKARQHVDYTVDEGLMTMGDARLLRVALTNLLSNAWKYTGGTLHPQVEFSQTQRDGKPIFLVRDNGAGFDTEQAGDRLFRPFQRFHAGQQFQGHGVGLAIVQRVIEKHGGKLWAESRPGEGATFFFTVEPGSSTLAAAAQR